MAEHGNEDTVWESDQDPFIGELTNTMELSVPTPEDGPQPWEDDAAQG